MNKIFLNVLPDPREETARVNGKTKLPLLKMPLKYPGGVAICRFCETGQGLELEGAP